MDGNEYPIWFEAGGSGPAATAVKLLYDASRPRRGDFQAKCDRAGENDSVNEARACLRTALEFAGYTTEEKRDLVDAWPFRQVVTNPNTKTLTLQPA